MCGFCPSKTKSELLCAKARGVDVAAVERVDRHRRALAGRVEPLRHRGSIGRKATGEGQ